MSKQEKLKARLLGKPKDFTWSELESLLKNLGFDLLKGKGSRRKFFHKERGVLINLHEPHPEKILKRYMVEQVIEKLAEFGDFNE
ncbi:hexulose-6-phosphate synthase [Vibrio splendidus]|uniref:type II toxin-antitoxin system HicA family toxin n=1 Tax=Vibrio splendidus TaxID=29497 RepID=UPI000C8644CC|nr:type II toxin-antitoxin system HicA family toxin [Vibrio splendidus]PMO05157.1 hexulose-6-phosphate synthase [Vibrio splendidus]